MSALPVAPLVGAWIEIFYDVDQADVAKVAPLVGAWIEISKKATACSAVRQSLLSWERGLKYQHMNLYTIIICCVIVELVVKSIFIAITRLINNTSDNIVAN